LRAVALELDKAIFFGGIPLGYDEALLQQVIPYAKNLVLLI